MEKLYWAKSDPMRAVFVVLSPGTSFPLRIAGRPATLKLTALKTPDDAGADSTVGSRASAAEARTGTIVKVLLKRSHRLNMQAGRTPPIYVLCRRPRVEMVIFGQSNLLGTLPV